MAGHAVFIDDRSDVLVERNGGLKGGRNQRKQENPHGTFHFRSLSDGGAGGGRKQPIALVFDSVIGLPARMASNASFKSSLLGTVRYFPKSTLRSSILPRY